MKRKKDEMEYFKCVLGGSRENDPSERILCLGLLVKQLFCKLISHLIGAEIGDFPGARQRMGSSNPCFL